MQQIKQLPEQQNYTQSNGQSRAVPALYFVGISLKGAFEKILFTLVMAGLFALVKDNIYILLTDTLPGLTRDFKIEIRDTSSVYIDGVQVGVNWVTLEIVQYLSDNHASIEEVAGDGEAIAIGLGDIAGKYGFDDIYDENAGKCETAAKEMAEYLKSKKKNGAIVTLTWTPANSEFIWSDIAGKAVGNNNIHVGVLYEGSVYCNIHPGGLPYDIWVADFVKPLGNTKLPPLLLVFRKEIFYDKKQRNFK